MKLLKTITFVTFFAFMSGCATNITSSLSSSADAVTPDITLNDFVDNRMALIKKEAAVGEGENIQTLAVLMKKTQPELFSQWMKANYAVLFENLDSANDLITRINHHYPLQAS